MPGASQVRAADLDGDGDLAVTSPFPARSAEPFNSLALLIHEETLARAPMPPDRAFVIRVENRSTAP